MWDTVKCKENKFNQTSAYQWKTKMSSFDQLWHFDTVFSSWLYSRGGHMVIWASSPRCQTSTSAPFSNARVVRLTWPSSYYSVALKCCQHTLAGLESRSFLSRDLDSLHHSPAVLFTHNGSWLLVYSFFFISFNFSRWGIREKWTRQNIRGADQSVRPPLTTWLNIVFIRDTLYWSRMGSEPKKRKARGKFGYLLSSQVADSQHLTPLCDHICKPATWYHTCCVSWWRLLLWPA